MQKNEIIHSIRETVRQVMPSGSRVILFGSQARGDAHHESDWDILILLDKSRIYNEDFDRVAYPLVELGWKIGADINPLIYTYTDWQRRSFTLFYNIWRSTDVYLWRKNGFKDILLQKIQIYFSNVLVGLFFCFFILFLYK